VGAALVRLRDVGLVPGMDEDLVRHIRVTNLAAVVHFLHTIPYYFIFVSLGLEVPANWVFMVVFWYAVTLGLNAFRLHDLSRLCLISSINVSIFVYSCLLGTDLGIHYVYYFSLIAPFILFHIRERAKLVFCAAQPVAFWILLQGPFGLVDNDAVPPRLEEIFHRFISTTAALMVLSCTLLIYILHQRTTSQLRRAKEAAEESLRAKGEFLATISHEIRTPMNGILGSAQLLAITPPGPRQKSYLDIIQASGNLLLAIINDILDFSKIESGKLELEEVDVDLGLLLEEVLSLHRPEADAKGLRLSLHLDPACPRRVRGDPTRLRQATLNLVSNAVKFTARGGVEVSLRLLGREEGRVRVAVAVRDTGIGIAQDKIAKLFQPFSQVDSSTTRQFGGTGLGLAIVRRLAALMGGDLSVETRQGEGSVFTFAARLRLPARGSGEGGPGPGKAGLGTREPAGAGGPEPDSSPYATPGNS
jgi:signal transduction histidine kinase